MRSQHRGYWCPGAKAPGHQYPQWWLNIYCIGPVSYKKIKLMVNNITKKIPFFKKWPSRLGVNSLAPERCGSKFTSVFFKLILRIDILSTSFENGHWWVPQNPIDDDKSTLVQVMTCFRQATSLLPEPMWTQISVAIGYHWAKMGQESWSNVRLGGPTWLTK